VAATIAEKDNSMGRFSVEVELANYKDLNRAEDGRLSRDQVRRTRVRGVVDTGATRLVIPEGLAQQLGLNQTGEVSVRCADGRKENRPLVGGIQLTYGGRSSVFNAIVEPQRESALIGAIVLEDLDLIPDCARQTLVPRDPKQIISEVE
jgi:predicted aspartyl protease